MDYKEMNFEELETRRAELAAEITEATDERLDAINAELDAIEARKKEIKAEAEERAKAIEEVIKAPAPTPIIEERNNDTMETRNTKEYIDAYAEYLKTGDDTECRALLTDNVSGGTVAAPELVEERIRTAWENDEIMRRVTRTFVNGNLKVGYEVSSSPAEAHTEGGAEVQEERLVLGIVELVPVMLKKWISISDEAMALRGQAFLDYIFDELEYRIVKLAADTAVDKIEASTLSATVTATSELSAFVEGFAALSDEATDVVAIMKRATYAAIKTAALSASFAFDPFEGRPVLFSEAVAANEIIVGDLKGVTANFPDCDEVKIKVDDRTLMTSDLVRILGKLYVGIDVTAPGRFAVVSLA